MVQLLDFHNMRTENRRRWEKGREKGDVFREAVVKKTTERKSGEDMSLTPFSVYTAAHEVEWVDKGGGQENLKKVVDGVGSIACRHQPLGPLRPEDYALSGGRGLNCTVE